MLQKNRQGGIRRLTEGMEIIKAEIGLTISTVGIAIKGNRKSKYVVKWALEKFIPEGIVMFKLINVRPQITAVPTPMGSVPLSQVRDDVAAAYRKEMEWQATERLLPYKKMCIQKKVQVDLVVLESDDLASALSEEVAKCSINKLVIGASSNGMFARKYKGKTLSSRISECIPTFCTVYVVSKGKLSSIRPAASETNSSIRDDVSEASFSTSSSSYTSSSQTTDPGSITPYSHFQSASLPMQRFQALSSINQSLNSKTNLPENNHSISPSLNIVVEDHGITTCPNNSDVGYPLSRVSSGRSVITDNISWISDQTSISDTYTDVSSESQASINFEVEKLRIELRHVRGMYAIAQTETIDASRKLNDLHKCRLEEEMQLKEICLKEEKAQGLARHEKEQYEAAKREAEYVKECAERETMHRKEAENRALHEAIEREKLENALEGPAPQYQIFTWEEIVSATSSFSENNRVGMGAYGTVYKGSFHHTTAAVKILHSKDGHKTKQFQQELNILSKIHHPHLLILLGACPDHGCLVYEYMANGSLDDRLLRKGNTPPIPWFERYQIAWEVASALVFLHSTKPKPIVHRDLKPANILLDHNFVSKIGDVGLATMLHMDPTTISTMNNDTGPVGTLCYIDPEYQRTGLISPVADVYAFGMVILQLLTAKPAMALAHLVETAIENDKLLEILDLDAGEWPLKETKELAILGLSCAELRRKDRPDLKDQILPALEKLKEIANRARNSDSPIRRVPPNHFICPIVKDVMTDPCVAADGYTYERRAIEKWLEEKGTSPMTNLQLPNKNLVPNYTLLSAIMEWKSSKH
ncbi:U-box domain [Dillenia turbinata]|uniref:RING-type E3 ubiquitin transferase n=1 Tax=Dillenia turbinata TaxID=194707 RepID=A0AAN8ZDP8_9MAGN